MPVLVFSMLDTTPLDKPAVSGGAAVVVSDHAQRMIREVMSGPVSALQPEHIPMLRALIEMGEINSDLRLVLGAIERHGGVAVRFI